MIRKITALTAALLITASLFSGCDKNKKPTGSDETDNTSAAVIENGTAATVETAPEFQTVFSDPGLTLLDPNSMNADIPDAVPDETIPPEKHEEVVSMIENTVITTKAPVIKEYNVDNKTRYGYSQLNDAEKKLYDDILEAVKSVKLKVAVDSSVTDEMWVKVYGCLYMQEPQLFWLTSKKVAKGRLWYWEVDTDTITSMQKEIDKKAAEVLAQADGKNTYEKLKIFHDYIVLNNNFIKEEGYNQTIYGGFVKGELQCEGYAKTMQYLCDLSGIECTVVVGTDKSGNSHAWNTVKVDGKWYNVDSTWDDPILTKVDVTNVRYRYFLVPDEWIHNKSHYNVNKKTTGTQVTYFTPPACTDTDMNYFKVSNQLYSDKDSADKALRDKLKSTASSKLRAAEIRVSSKDVYDAVTANLSEYASWIKGENSSVSKVSSNCDENTLVIELDLEY